MSERIELSLRRQLFLPTSVGSDGRRVGGDEAEGGGSDTWYTSQTRGYYSNQNQRKIILRHPWPSLSLRTESLLDAQYDRDYATNVIHLRPTSIPLTHPCSH